MAFYEKCSLPGIIGAIDGSHIRIVAPKKELQNLYYNRKGYYSINALVVCDHKMKIMYINAKHHGASHDSMVFLLYALKGDMKRMYANGQLQQTWLLGDAGYALKPYLMTPFRNAEYGSRELTFNKKHAKGRNIIERTFGVWKNRFRCLLSVRALHYTPKKATQIINVCAALHNICLFFNVSNPIEDLPDVIEYSEPEINVDEELNSHEAVNIRNQIMLTL